MKKKFVIIVFVTILVFLFLEFVNGRADFWDFRVYYDAANELLLNNSPYGKSFGLSSGFYKYSPVTLLFFSLISWMPYTFASIFFYVVISVVFSLLMLAIHDFLCKYILLKSKKKYLPFLLISIIVSAHVIRELHLGNINLMLLLLYFIAFESIENKKEFLGGVLIAVGLFFKPHFIVLIPLLVLKVQWKSILGIIATSGVLIFLPAVFFGVEKNKLLMIDWFSTMSSHNHDLLTSPNTIYGLINNQVLRYLGLDPIPNTIPLVLFFVALGIFSVVVFNNLRLKDNFIKPLANYLEYFLLIALIPNLTHTDTEHFLWSLPLIMLLIYLIMNIRNIKKRVFLAVFILIITFSWYLNSPDILPMKLVSSITNIGLLGLSNLILIGLTLYLFYSEREALY